ncbi:hypothetical protein ALG30_003745 [Escherichia coli]|nr:hypothetical protein [Escherichia coli]
MSRKYLIRITELERLLSEQAEALRQKDQQLSLVEETEAFLRSALARAEEKIEEEEREIEHLRAQYSAAIFLIPICISFDTAEKRRYATYLILNRRFSFAF